MCRIGVFVFYDPCGYVDDYVEVLLNSMCEILKKLIIIINGKIENLGYRKLKKYSDYIYVRENRGYDAGAYKDTFTIFLNGEDWTQWDEIILFNNTFYGPIYSWKSIFNIMEKAEADFWGLSRHPGGGELFTGKEITSHIQTYFLVCKKSLFLSCWWKEFWGKLVYPNSYYEAIESFEIFFTKFFEERRYQGKAFTDKCHINIKYGNNPYLCNFKELIQNCGFPVLKRRAICLNNLKEAKSVINYIRVNTSYDIDNICSHVERLCKESEFNPIVPFIPGELERFYNKYKKIYIYGHGAYGKGIAEYFEFKGWKYEGFIVSENHVNEVDLFIFENMKFDSESGIVLALGKKAFCEVYPMVKKVLSDSQLYYPPYIILGIC